MNGQIRQGFSEPEVDYRHVQLMAEVAQHLIERKARRRRVHNLLHRWRQAIDRPAPRDQSTRSGPEVVARCTGSA
jgi:hypothetical protein